MDRKNKIWYKNAVFYELYVRAFFDSNNDGHGDLRGMTQKLDYLQDLGIDCLWIMPIYPSPLKDDGYDIADYYQILPEYGILDDFKALIDEVHAREMRLIVDLVLNHTSDQHPWFQAARSDKESPYRDYYVWSDTSYKYGDARIIFLDTETSNWTWDEVAGQYYWHRFYSSQPDLNYDNPRVQEEMIKVMQYWLDLGVDGFRADAVPYLFEREGTNCENLPETHAFIKRVRKFLDQNYPGRILLAEANQWPEDVRAYFGDGDEFHMGFHFPVMPRIFMALRKGDRTPIKSILDRTPEIPENCQWCTFLRNHDELTLEMVTEEEREWMWKEYAPDVRMRLNLGIRRRLAPLLDNDQRKIELAYSLLFTLPGSPIIYYGDEIGMGDDVELPDRNGVRTPMQWDSDINAGFSGTDASLLYSPIITHEQYNPQQVSVIKQISLSNSLYNRIRKMIQIRKGMHIFSRGSLEWVEAIPDALAAYWRKNDSEKVLVINNLSNTKQNVIIQVDEPFENIWVELLTERSYESKGGKMRVELEPFEYMWFKNLI